MSGPRNPVPELAKIVVNGGQVCSVRQVRVLLPVDERQTGVPDRRVGMTLLNIAHLARVSIFQPVLALVDPDLIQPPGCESSVRGPLGYLLWPALVQIRA